MTALAGTSSPRKNSVMRCRILFSPPPCTSPFSRAVWSPSGSPRGNPTGAPNTRSDPPSSPARVLTEAMASERRHRGTPSRRCQPRGASLENSYLGHGVDGLRRRLGLVSRERSGDVSPGRPAMAETKGRRRRLRRLGRLMRPGEEGSGAAKRYPAVAPSASAMCRDAAKCGVERGRCRTRRRTERTTCTPSLSSRVRNQLT